MRAEDGGDVTLCQTRALSRFDQFGPQDFVCLREVRSHERPGRYVSEVMHPKTGAIGMGSGLAHVADHVRNFSSLVLCRVYAIADHERAVRREDAEGQRHDSREHQVSPSRVTPSNQFRVNVPPHSTSCRSHGLPAPWSR